MKKIHFLSILLCLLAVSLTAAADDYMNYLTTQRGFTEVKTVGSIDTGADNYYILVPAETREYIVGIGRYEDKPGWASEDSKALRYHSAATDPALVLSNFFTIEKATVSGTTYIGFRNVVYSADMFQTHDNAGFMYVNTYTDKTLDEWSYLIPTFQDGYWMFENGKYPMSSEAQWKGYMGSWTPGRFAVDEPIALNRTNASGDVAGHYRLFKIAKDQLMSMYTAAKREQLLTATSSNLIDATWLITNPSFETGDATGWTLQYKEANNNEFNTRQYGMSNKEGDYLMNVYQKWNDHSVSQIVNNIPTGEYTLSAVLCSWEDRTATLTGNSSLSHAIATAQGVNDQTGIPVSVDVTVGFDQQLTIIANSTTDWWSEGHTGNDDYYAQLFYKVDNVQLTCKGVFLNAFAQPLPNNNTTVLEANQWYYYDVPFPSDYWLSGNINGMVYSTDGMKPVADVTTSTAQRKTSLPKDRVYFKTTQSDATLSINPAREVTELGTFTAVALNVDGLPQEVVGIELNADGPGSEGTKKISQYLASKSYDFIGCSEDFNYHGSLISSLQNDYSWGKERASLSASGLSFSMLINGFRFDTDGLNLLWKKGSCGATNESWTQWESLAKTDGNQYVKKGYRHYDMTVGNQTFDVYILHMDAGDTNATDSRESQWRQLTDAINIIDQGRDALRPKLIIGDTNSRWTREDIKTNFLDRLSSNFVASDVWVEIYRNGVCPTTDMNDLTDKSDPTNYSNYEIVDKIIYINPKAANTLQLVPQSFKIEQDYTYEDGTTPLGDHPPVVVEFKYVKSGNEIPFTELEDAANNSQAIADANGSTGYVTLSGRTLVKDNSWNTICLPFDMTEEQVSSQLAPATDGLMSYTGSSFDDSKGELTLNFENATSIAAGTPYIIKWASGDNITNPVFTGVTISNTNAAVVGSDGAASFIGTYAPVNIYTDAKTKLYLGDGNTLYYPTSTDFNVNAFRAYFQLNNGLTAGEPSSLVKSFVMNFGDDTETGIFDVRGMMEDGRGMMEDVQIYNLAGQRLKKAQRGVNIINGKKVVIK